MKAEMIMTGATLDEKRARVAKLETRGGDLRRQIKAATDRDSELQEGVEVAKSALAEGSGGQAAVTAALKALNEHRVGLEHLREALGKVESQYGALDAEVQAHELRIETARQSKLAEQEHQKAEALFEEFLQNIAEIAAPLVDRGVLANHLSLKLPLARPIEPLTLDELAVALRDEMRLDDRIDHRGIVHFLRVVLAGPGEMFTHHQHQHLFLKG